MAGKISPLTHESFVRVLPFTQRQWLASTLDICDSWEILAAQIPLKCDDLLSPHSAEPFVARYSTQSFMAFKRQRSPTLSLLDDWDTENCQIKHLIQALYNARLFDAANHISAICVPLPQEGQKQQQQQQHQQKQQQPQQQKSQQQQPQQQKPQQQQPQQQQAIQEHVVSYTGGRVCEALQGPPVQEQIEGEQLQMNHDKDSTYGDSPTQRMPEFSFEVLRRITKNFDTKEKAAGGSLIGRGGFGDVFFGQFLGTNVAVKRLKDNSEESLRQFETEVKTLCTYKHQNLVTLLGYCSDRDSPCLVYEFVVNGSLEDRLACLHGSPPLSVSHRLVIATGTAKGIDYLHGKGVTHRDIKSANILLDEDFKPKVSDFATARTLPKAESKETRKMQTMAIIGTTFYLDPEAYDYAVHPGLDIYSFGVVILELLTGLPVYDPSRENQDLKVHVREYCTPYVPDEDDSDDEEAVGDAQNDGTIFDLVDKRAGVLWKSWLVDEMYTLSNQCLAMQKNRKKIKNVLKKLESLSNSYEDGGDCPEK